MDTIKVGGGGKDDLIKIGFINQDTQASQVYDKDGISPTLSAGTHGYANGYVNAEVEVGTWRTHEDKKGFRKIKDGTCPTIPARAREDGSGQPVIKIKSANKQGFENADLGGNSVVVKMYEILINQFKLW